jgi:hypothetical protein
VAVNWYFNFNFKVTQVGGGISAMGDVTLAHGRICTSN